MRKLFNILMIISLVSACLMCNSGNNKAPQTVEEEQNKMVKKHRDDGTLSSINPVDEEGYVHGVKVNFYEDGMTVHSKVTFEHGRKHGPAIWFFKNGKSRFFRIF